MTQLSNGDDSHIFMSEGGDEDVDTVLAISNSDGGNESEDKENIRPPKKAKTVQEPLEVVKITVYIEVVSPPYTLKAKPTSVTCGIFLYP